MSTTHRPYPHVLAPSTMSQRKLCLPQLSKQISPILLTKGSSKVKWRSKISGTMLHQALYPSKSIRFSFLSLLNILQSSKATSDLHPNNFLQDGRKNKQHSNVPRFRRTSTKIQHLNVLKFGQISTKRQHLNIPKFRRTATKRQHLKVPKFRRTLTKTSASKTNAPKKFTTW